MLGRIAACCVHHLATFHPGAAFAPRADQPVPHNLTLAIDAAIAGGDEEGFCTGWKRFAQSARNNGNQSTAHEFGHDCGIIKTETKNKICQFFYKINN